jgi:hypothetical protein
LEPTNMNRPMVRPQMKGGEWHRAN